MTGGLLLCRYYLKITLIYKDCKLYLGAHLVGVALHKLDLLVQLDVVRPQLVHLVLEQVDLLLHPHGLLHETR